MTTREELDAARELLTRARRSAAYEHRALTLLMSARKDSIERLDDQPPVGASPHKETQHYRAHLGEHVARLQAALEHLDQSVIAFNTIQAQFEKQHSPPVRPSATLVLFPARAISAD